MAMYNIIGADGKEYGPVTADQIRRWVSEGRANAQTRVRAEGSAEWQDLGSLSEFADALASQPPPLVPNVPPDMPRTGEVPLDREYELDIGACFSRGWDLLQKNFSTLFLASLIYFLIEGALAGLGAIPFVGPVFSLANWVIIGPLVGGLFWVFIQVNRGRTASPGDVFAGFQKAFGNLVLGAVVPGLLAALCLLPAVLVGCITLLPAILNNRDPEPWMLVPIGLVALVCVVPMIFLQVNWTFTLPLVIDKGMGFWPAMGASWTMVRKHWWRVFAVCLLGGLLYGLGMLLCCVGVLFTMPIIMGALAQAYETIFVAAPADKG